MSTDENLSGGPSRAAEMREPPRCGNPHCTRHVYAGEGAHKNGLCDKCDGHRAMLASVIYGHMCMGRAVGAAPPDPSVARRAAEALLVELDKPFGAG